MHDSKKSMCFYDIHKERQVQRVFRIRRQPSLIHFRVLNLICSIEAKRLLIFWWAFNLTTRCTNTCLNTHISIVSLSRVWIWILGCKLQLWVSLTLFILSVSLLSTSEWEPKDGSELVGSLVQRNFLVWMVLPFCFRLLSRLKWKCARIFGPIP